MPLEADAEETVTGEDGDASVLLGLRDATVPDASALAALTIASWRAAYADILPRDYLAALDPVDREERLRAQISAPDVRRFAVVAFVGDRLEGFVTGGPLRDDEPATSGEVYAIYVHPSHWGGGVGGTLLDAAEDRLLARGFPAAAIWVFTRNEKARRFYERRGWRLERQRGFWQRDGVRRQLVCYGKMLAPV